MGWRASSCDDRKQDAQLRRRTFVVVGKVYVTLGLVWLAVVVEIAFVAAVVIGGLRLLQALD